MIYAQAGHGRRATLFTDYTFAVKSGNELVPFTKAYSGLTDAEFKQITSWVKKNTLQRFGPVRQVTPQHVFEIAFEGIQASPRHKSGSRFAFRACCGGAKTSRWTRSTHLRTFKKCCANSDRLCFFKIPSACSFNPPPAAISSP
jgi:ATP-dependent DNA ligase